MIDTNGKQWDLESISLRDIYEFLSLLVRIAYAPDANSYIHTTCSAYSHPRWEITQAENACKHTRQYAPSAVCSWLQKATTNRLLPGTTFSDSFFRQNFQSCTSIYACIQCHSQSHHPLERSTLQRFCQQFLPRWVAGLATTSLRFRFCNISSIHYMSVQATVCIGSAALLYKRSNNSIIKRRKRFERSPRRASWNDITSFTLLWIFREDVQDWLPVAPTRAAYFQKPFMPQGRSACGARLHKIFAERVWQKTNRVP